jgi:hypothetical protein
MRAQIRSKTEGRGRKTSDLDSSTTYLVGTTVVVLVFSSMEVAKR